MGYPKEDRIRDATIAMRAVFGRCHRVIEELRLHIFFNHSFPFMVQKSTEARMPELFKLMEEELIMTDEAEEEKPASEVVEGFVADLKKGA